MIFVPLMFAGSLIVTPVRETVWWRTAGAQVLEHHDKDNADCALWLYSDAGGVFFKWQRGGEISVLAVNQTWQFQDAQKTAIALQIGDVWISNGDDDSTVIEAIGHGSSAGFSLKHSVEDRLRSANQIRVLSGRGEFIVPLKHGSMDVLLASVHKCRASLGG